MITSSNIIIVKHLAEKVTQDGEPYQFVITWLRTVLSFEILRSVHAWVRGSRTPFHKIGDSVDDCSLNVTVARIEMNFLFK